MHILHMNTKNSDLGLVAYPLSDLVYLFIKLDSSIDREFIIIAT